MTNSKFKKQPTLLSPLRYPGSKRQLAGYIKECFRLNRKRPSLFVETFAGGASVSLQLMQENLVERIGLIDLDPLVAAFWETVFFDADWLVNQIETIPVTLDKWMEMKKSVPRERRQRALACLFLNRTSFSGILAPGAGPIGGYEQKSDYDISCRFPRKTLKERIRKVEAYKDRVDFIWNLHWADALKMLNQRPNHEDALYYFDPPFFEKAHRLYRYYFKEEDHKQFRDTVLTLENEWILSYDSMKQVEKLYGNIGKAAQVEVIYSTSQGKNKITREIIISNLSQLPDRTESWRKVKDAKPAPIINTLQKGNEGFLNV